MEFNETIGCSDDDDVLLLCYNKLIEVNCEKVAVNYMLSSTAVE